MKMSELPRFRLAVGLIAALALNASPASRAQGAPPAPASPAPVVAGQRIDLSRYFFASPQAEQADREQLEADLQQFTKMQGEAAASPERLLEALQRNDQLQISVTRHAQYLFLRCRMNRKDATTCADSSAIESLGDSRTASLSAEIVRIPSDRMDSFFKAEPRLQQYRYAIEVIRRDGPHLVEPQVQEVLSDLDPELEGWQYDLYSEIVSRIDFGKIATPNGPLDVAWQRSLIAVSLDRAVRREGFEKRCAGYASRRDLIAFSLVRTAQARNKLAALHKFDTYPDEKYFELSLEPEATRKLIARASQQGDLSKRFEAIQAQDMKARFGITDPAKWDMGVPTTEVPLVSLDQARSLLHQALAGVGSWYQREFDDLIDPKSGRADIVPGGAPNRYGGGFSKGFAGVTGVLFVGTFDGTYRDLSVIAHEGGHAVHRQLMNEAGVPACYASGPNYMFESFADFNELVLADYLAALAKEPLVKRYYLERFLATKGLDFLAGADDAAIELAVYDGARAGTLAGADDLDAMTLKIDGQFSVWPDKQTELRGRWATMSLLYEDPVYYQNYIYASLLALKYYSLYEAKPRWFLPRYRALLQNGFNDTPEHLLRKFLEIDLNGDALLQNAVALADGRLKALEVKPARPGAVD
jgi:oligoendopeptidase F